MVASLQAQTPFTSLLYTSGNITNDETNPTEFTACQTDSTLSSLGTDVSTDQLGSLQGISKDHLNPSVQFLRSSRTVPQTSGFVTFWVKCRLQVCNMMDADHSIIFWLA